jgi:hypothetical protein
MSMIRASAGSRGACYSLPNPAIAGE